MIDTKNRRLYRSPKEGLVLGVAAGMADYLEVDVVYVRLGWIALAFFSHVWPAIVLYVILSFIVPIDPSQETVPHSQSPKDVTDREPAEKMDADQNM